MKNVLGGSIILALTAALLSSAAYAKDTGGGYKSYTRTSDWTMGTASPDNPNAANGNLRAPAQPAVILASYKFDSGATCTAQGWVTVDITQQTGSYWHIDDAAGMGGGVSVGGVTFLPIAGAHSLWMGARPAGGPVLCGFAALPGYGNGWNQAWCSKDCLATAGGPTADLDVSMTIKFDSEPSYDATSLEYTTDCAGNVGWTEIDGGKPLWTGAANAFVVNGSYVVGPGPVKVRLHFTSDTSWSNQDGFYPGLGVVVDDLSWETTAPENFEGEAVGANQSNDWINCNTPGYGNYLALFKKTCFGAGCTFADYRDLCADNLSCYWAAILNSTEFYTCEAPPFPNSATQRVVPHVNVRNQYISNEIWSPVIPFGAVGAGGEVRLRYTVYRDLPIENLIFHVWHVRTIDGGGCPGPWQDSNFVYYSDAKDWFSADVNVGPKLDLTFGVSMQVALGVVDMCPVWCGVFGTGACHSPAPYLDEVEVERIPTWGPQWDVRDIETFQDTFPTDGTIIGTARADAAMDIKPSTSPTITPGDSAVVLSLVDPEAIGAGGANPSGLLNDPNLSLFIGRDKVKKAAYMWVSVWPQGQAGKSGAALSEGPGGQANRYPHIPAMDFVDVSGNTWTAIRFDYTYSGTVNVAGVGLAGQPRVECRFNVDLPDNLFEAGDTVCYFYGASSVMGNTYFSSNWGATPNIAEVAANPMEFTILPAGGFNRGGDILYVDGADGVGSQPYFDGALQILGLLDKVDRFDVLGPSSGVSNRPSSRVYNVANQLSSCYRKILWDTGPLSITLGDGSGDPEKTDDYLMVDTFLANLGTPGFPWTGGIYLCGDRVAEYLNGYGSASAVLFRGNYMTFALASSDHRTFGLGVSPAVKHWPGRAFTDDFFVFGGCPQLNDFDVLAPAGASLIEMSYTAPQNANGALLSQVNGFARVMMSGFSFQYIRDDETDGISDRAQHLRDIIFWLGNPIGQVVGVGPALKNDLSQNYPNPFNPQTTITFSLKERGKVSLGIYNVAGQLVRTLANEDRGAGPHKVVWDGRDGDGQPVSSGVYFYKLVANNFSQTKKMVLLK